MKNTNNSVKKHQTYVILLFAVLIGYPSLGARAQVSPTKVDHYVGMYVKAGEWTLLPKESQYGFSYGAAGGVGALYELQAGLTYSPARFLLDVGVGVTGGMTNFMQSSDQMAVLENQIDLDHEPFSYVYELKGRKDQYTNVAAQMPILIGVQTGKFYMLAGVNLTANMYTLSNSTALLTTYGKYEMYDDHRNMPEYQFFNDMDLKSSVRTNFNFDLDASFEIGGRLGFVTDAVGFDVPKRKTELRLGAFVEYGLLDLHVKSERAPVDMPERYDVEPTSPNYVYKTRTMVDNLKLNDVMSSAGFASSVNSLLVGIKFQVLFQMPQEGKCVICRDAYVRSASHGKSGTGVKHDE